MTPPVEFIFSERGEPCSNCGWPGATVGGLCNFCRESVRVTLELAQKQIFTAGYAGVKIERFKAAVAEMGAVVFDIRFKPVSSWSDWRQDRLRAELGASYRHLADLGNRNYKNPELGIEIVNLSRGVDEVLRESRPCVLLCGCAQRLLCHRYTVGRRIEERGCRVEEIEEWD